MITFEKKKRYKLLLISKTQFGYLTDYYYYTKYIGMSYDFEVICYDDNLDKIKHDFVIVNYIKRKIKYSRIEIFRLIIYGIIAIYKEKPDMIIVEFFSKCFLIKLFAPVNKILLDIRTGSIGIDEKKRKKANQRIKFESNFFNYINIVSENLKSELNINVRNTMILPVGGNISKRRIKEKNSVYQILYVGVLNTRRIEDTIEGLKIYLSDIHCLEKIRYDIVGYGTKDVEKRLKEIVEKNHLTKIVTFHGRKKVTELDEYYDRADVAVVYIPIIPAYTNQPSTKLLEALLKGIPVIATNTKENKLLVSEKNGILIEDSPQAFAYGLKKLLDNYDRYNSEDIIKSVSEYDWQKITNILKTRIEKIIMEEE